MAYALGELAAENEARLREIVVRGGSEPRRHPRARTAQAPTRTRTHRAAPLQADILETAPSGWAVHLVKSLVFHMTGEESTLPDDGATWAQMAAEARSKIIGNPEHIHDSERWLDTNGEGYFAKWATDNE